MWLRARASMVCALSTTLPLLLLPLLLLLLPLLLLLLLLLTLLLLLLLLLPVPPGAATASSASVLDDVVDDDEAACSAALSAVAMVGISPMKAVTLARNPSRGPSSSLPALVLSEKHAALSTASRSFFASTARRTARNRKNE